MGCAVRPLWLVLPLYIVRGALMNARGPIVRAMVMDLVPTEVRGRWNSVQSLSSFTWSGSAALGGYIADVGDYRFTFAVTASVYSFSFLICCLLLFVCPKEKKGPQEPAMAMAGSRCNGDLRAAAQELLERGTQLRVSGVQNLPAPPSAGTPNQG